MKKLKKLMVLGLLVVITMGKVLTINSFAANDVQYKRDIAKHHYSIRATDRDRANDFIFAFYNIAFTELQNRHTGYLVKTYGTYFNQPRDNVTVMSWASPEVKTEALQCAARNAVLLYDEAVNKPNRRFEVNQILIAADLMNRMTSDGYDDSDFSAFRMQGRDIFVQTFIDAGILQGNATSPTIDPSVESLKSYAGNNSEFNAYTYYSKYPDLQASIGANGDSLLKHYNDFGKNEGRVAK